MTVSWNAVNLCSRDFRGRKGTNWSRGHDSLDGKSEWNCTSTHGNFKIRRRLSMVGHYSLGVYTEIWTQKDV